MFSVKSISTIFSILVLCISSVHAGVWQNLIDEGQLEEAQKRAKTKLRVWEWRAGEYTNDGQIEKITNHVANHFPELNPDVVRVGMKDFFVAKQEKWKARLDDWISSQAAYKWQICERTLQYACNSSVRTFFHQQAIKALEKIKAHSQTDDMLAYSSKLLPLMNVDKEVQNLQKLHTGLNNKLQDMMGMTPDLLSKPYKSKSIVVMLDEFNKNTQGMNKPWGIESQPQFPQWKIGDPLNTALDWKHGDCMTSLNDIYSPQTEIHRVCTNHLYTLNNPFLKNPLTQLKEHYNGLNLPAIVNYSYIPASISSYLQKTGREISLVKEYPSDPQSLNALRETLEFLRPNENWQGPLSANQLAFLQELDVQRYNYKDVSAKFKEFVVGSGTAQSHLLMASPSNQDGPLTRTEFHNGRMTMLEDDQMKDHALIALNYDLTSKSLRKGSHSAEEYKHMSVVIPAGYISVLDHTNPLPYFHLGGHSSATAILSAGASIVRGHYPELNRQEIRQAILEGANKKFPGYKEELHGQGMLNLKGALDVAEQIRSSTRVSI